MSWGGKRAHAGRKARAASGEARENISTRVSAETARKIRAAAERRNVPMGQIIDDLAKRLPEAK